MKEFLRVLFVRDPVKYLRKKGVTIGKNTRLTIYPYFWSLPLVGSEPWLISIGDHCLISFGVTFVTHDGSVSVIRDMEKYKKTIKFGRIVIGNNCFIGCNTTIMPNVSIGDNSIVGSCSLVTKSIPSGEAWGGVPAKFICTTEEYAEKMLKCTPEYSVDNLNSNFKEETSKIADAYFKNRK